MKTESVVCIRGASGSAARVINQYATLWPSIGYVMTHDSWDSLNKGRGSDTRSARDRAEWSRLSVKTVDDVRGYWMTGVPPDVVLKRVRNLHRTKRGEVFIPLDLYDELRAEYHPWWAKAKETSGTYMFLPVFAHSVSSNYVMTAELALYTKKLREFSWVAPKNPQSLAVWQEEYETIKAMALRIDADYKLYEDYRGRDPSSN